MLYAYGCDFFHTVDECERKNVQQIGLHSKIRLQRSDELPRKSNRYFM